MNSFVEVIKEELTKLKKMLKQTGTDYTATVTRVDGNTAYVQMSGSEISDTPVSMTINANVGDKVRVRVSNGKAWITGNDTAPPSDNKQVIEMIENNSQGLIETEAKYSRIDQTIDQITIEVGEVDTKADNAQATADGRMKADMSNKASSITVNSGQIAFNSNSLVVNSSKFTLDQNGNATFGGALDAASGTFAGKVDITWRPEDGTDYATNVVIGQNSYRTQNLYPGISVIEVNGEQGGYTVMAAAETTYYATNTVLSKLNVAGYGIFIAEGSKWAQLTVDGVRTSSDIRLKEDITKIDPETAKHLLPVQFRFKGDDKIHYGFIAQDVQKIIPDAVTEDKNGYLSLNYQELIAPLYALVQEQEKRIETLEKQLKGGDQ